MSSFPSHLYDEWDSNVNEKNLDDYSLNSKFYASWVCSTNSKHKWTARISHRSSGTKCPYCTNKKLLAGDNDLATKHPNLVREWSSKNTISPNAIVYGAAKKVWWVCTNNHEWEDSISNRSLLGRGCPYCNGAKPIIGVNDFASLYPELAKQWSSKNSLDPKGLLPKSNRKAFWTCEEGHEWEATVANRTHNKTGCPICVNQKVLEGYNDFASTHVGHSILKEWSSKNSLKPNEVAYGSNRKMLWLGECGHEWESRIHDRVRGFGCPYCTNRKVLEGFNDLATTHPELAKQLSEKNNFIASEIIAAKDDKVWWLGSCGHEWEANIYKRKDGQNCPYCAHKKLLQGFNDLATTHPKIAKELSEKNNFSASEIIGGKDKKVVWECANGHEWDAVVYSRKRGNGCPKCNITVSAPEQAIRDFLEQFDFDVKYNDRKVLEGLELDFYIPEKNVAIEFNGLYWHTETQGKDKNYHYSKWLTCKNKGIQLIQVWEDDWNRNPTLIKNMLANKLGVNVQDRVYARKTSIVNVDYETAKIFMEVNHIQGWVQGSYYVGLQTVDSNELVALCILKKESKTDGKVLNLVRYATSMKVVGGFTKILKHVENTYMPEKIITFSDNSISDGGLYENNGFVADKELPPDYQYYVDNERSHKFGYRLKRFKNDDSLVWVDGLSETELAVLNNIDRIWDSGKTRWVKSF